MKTFIHDTLYIFLICIGLILPIEIATRLIQLNNIYSTKYFYMETRSSEIKTLLLGSSLFEFSFNSNIIGDSTFNLAMCGRVSFYDAQLLEKYIDKMPNLKVILFPIHYALDNPCNYYDSREKEAYVYHYYKYMKISTPGSMYLYYMPKVTFLWEKKNSGTFFNVSNLDETGYVRIDTKITTVPHPIERRYTQAYSTPFINNFERIAQLCYEHQIRLIAVTPPATDVYLKYTTPEGLSQLNDIIERIQKVYPIEYHNYLSDSAFREYNFYCDETHLNHLGATKFAERVKNDFKL